jgi:hypothetical protein
MDCPHCMDRYTEVWGMSGESWLCRFSSFLPSFLRGGDSVGLFGALCGCDLATDG